MSDYSSDSDEGAMDFAALEAQAHTNMTIEEANKLNRQKLMAIMKSNDKLKKDLRQLKKEGSDNYRVKQIKNLRQQLRETQSIADALTKTLMNKTGMKPDEVGELYDDILSQPKLAKPNNPVKLKKEVLVLQQQQTTMERELAATKKLLREYRSGERRVGDDDGPLPARRAAAAPSDSAVAEELRQLKLEHEITLGEVETKARVVAMHRDMCAKLQTENRELRSLRMQWDVLVAQKEAAEREARRVRDEMGRTAEHTEEHHQDIRELRTKLASLLSVRDKVESTHAAQVQSLNVSVAKVQERESHILTQMRLLQTDLKHAHDTTAWYKQQLATAKAASTSRTAESDAVRELQTKLKIVSKDLKETKLELRSSASNKTRPGEAERALQERVAKLQRDNSRLNAQLDTVERKYIVHHETRLQSEQRLDDLQGKYHATLKDAEGKHAQHQDAATALKEARTRVAELEQRLQAGADQWARAQQEQALQRVEWDKQEQLVAQLRAALNDRRGAPSASSSDGPGHAAHNAPGALSSRSSSTDDLFSSRDDDSATSKALRRAEEVHLEHVAKLMRNFESKEKEHLHQIARLQEQLKPGSGNRTHLQYGKQTSNAPRAASNAKAFNIDTSDEESEDESDEDDDDLDLDDDL